MRGILDYDGPVLGLLSKIGDMIVLNFLIALFSLPVITIGAAQTAGAFAALKIVREEGDVIPNFVKSFRENIKQATVIWLLIIGTLVIDIVILYLWGAKSGTISMCCVVFILLLFLVSFWIFPVLSKFRDSTRNIIKIGFVLCFRHLFRTIVMLIVTIFPIVIVLLFKQLLPVIALCACSFSPVLHACLYHSVFVRLEEQVLKSISEN